MKYEKIHCHECYGGTGYIVAAKMPPAFVPGVATIPKHIKRDSRQAGEFVVCPASGKLAQIFEGAVLIAPESIPCKAVAL